jgi:serine/threonine protein kinase
MLEGYDVLSLLGRGGIGEVYLARDMKLGRRVAIKLLKPRFALDSEVLSSFEQEARSTCALNHPNIITIYELGRSGDTLYIAMEYVEGTTLRQLLANGRLEFRMLLNLATQMADGLAKAHANGIVHLDLKPENIMVTDEGLVKILDFGMAVAIPRELETARVGSPGSLRGTLAYMSPEQVRSRSVDFRSDQFSFGAVLLEMATGFPAFRRSTAIETLGAVTKGEPLHLSSARRRFPGSFCRIIERCLEKNKVERYASTVYLARELERALVDVGRLAEKSRGGRKGCGRSIGAGMARRRQRFRFDTGCGNVAFSQSSCDRGNSQSLSRIKRKPLP